MSNLKLLKVHKPTPALLDDLRRLVQAGVTPKSGPWNSETLGWTRDTWLHAQELGIQLLGRNLYSERLGPLREIVKALHQQEGIPHAGFAKVSLGGDAQNMIKDLAIFYLTYRHFPERDKANQGQGGWSLSSSRLAGNIGIRLASINKYRYWFKSVDEAEQLALQLIRHGYNGNQPVTGMMSQLNFVPAHVNKRSFINFIREHPRWNLRPNQPLPIPVMDHTPEETADVSDPSPLAKLKSFLPSAETVAVDTPPPAPSPVAKPTPASSVPAQLTPKYLPGKIVLVRPSSMGSGHWIIGQVEEVGVKWTRDGTSAFSYTITDADGSTHTASDKAVFSADEFVDQLADLTKMAETNPQPMHTWRTDHALTQP